MAEVASSGQFVELSDGKVHFEISGRPEGPRVVLIHGLATPYFGWDPTFRELVASGFRVLRYDLFGRGLSGCPRKANTPDFFDMQLDELVQAVGMQPPFDMFGWSMGSLIAATYIDRRPKHVRRLVLIGPAGFPMKLSRNMALFKVPVLGEFLFALNGKDTLLKGAPMNFYEPSRFGDFYKKFEEQFPCNRAILSSLRKMPLTDHLETYTRIGRQRRHIKIVWGMADRVTPFKNAEQALDLFPNATLLSVDQAAHGPHYELPHVVNPEVVRFLSEV